MTENTTSNPFTTPAAEITSNEQPPSSQNPSSNTQSIRNVKDLVTLLEGLQARIDTLETENRRLKADLSRKITKKELASVIANLDQVRLPKLGMFSDSFFLRAISIYGHWFTANIMVSVILTIITTIVVMTVGQEIFESLLNIAP